MLSEIKQFQENKCCMMLLFSLMKVEMGQIIKTDLHSRKAAANRTTVAST